MLIFEHFLRFFDAISQPSGHKAILPPLPKSNQGLCLQPSLKFLNTPKCNRSVGIRGGHEDTCLRKTMNGYRDHRGEDMDCRRVAVAATEREQKKTYSITGS